MSVSARTASPREPAGLEQAKNEQGTAQDRQDANAIYAPLSIHDVLGPVWQKRFDAVSGQPDMEYAMADATIVKVHRHGQGARGFKTKP